MKTVRTIFYLLFLILIINCKCGFQRSGFQFSEVETKLISAYKLNDTVYFKNKFNDLDTITISNIDSIDRYGAILGFPRKYVRINIKHLPQNNWISGVELSKEGKEKRIDQDLVVIEKAGTKERNSVYIGFHYRDFEGRINDANKTITSQLLSDLNINKYWEIEMDSMRYKWIKEKEHKKEPLITKIIWTEHFGLTGYYKDNGDFYKIQVHQ